MRANHLTRIRLISISILLFAVVLIGRLYMLQIVDSDVYLDKADRQYSGTAKNIFSRGSIYFKNKDNTLVSAATLKSGATITINPQIIKDPEEVYLKLNEVIPVDHDDFIKKASKKTDPYEEILVRQDPNIGQKVDDLKIVGLKTVRERWRFYPGGKIGAHVVGILGFKGDEFAGRYGLEKQYEQELVREQGAYSNFFAQIFEGVKKASSETQAEEADIVTTIEPTVQAYLENILATTTERWSADRMGAIIMDPMTGEIYAMEAYPTFDPNHPEEQKNSLVFSNPLVESVYEMGSIIKPLTISAGIDAGVITPSSTYYDAGFIWVSGKKVSNFDGKERGVVGMQDVLSQSLNVGSAHVQRLLGNKKFAEYMFKFGINKKTGIELPNEAKNLADNLNGRVDIDFASASFGQGIALTPISTIRALAAVANGGTLVNPHVVKSINYKLGLNSETKIVEGERVISKETSEKLARMLTYSIDNVLSNGKYKMTNYSVAAKTGTAQIAKANGKGYEENKVMHTFVGYFPSYNPRFIILLFMIDPKGARFGSETLTMPFNELVKFLINYYEVPPDR